MTMPTWDETMYPVLSCLSDGDVHTSAELREVVSLAFEMTQEERSERLEKSGQLRLSNRIGWGLTDMNKAGLVQYGDKRGTYRITEAGLAFLDSHGPEFRLAALEAIPSFAEWKSNYREKRAKAVPDEDAIIESPSKQSPEEVIEAACDELHDALADELLEKVYQQDPFFFERLVTKLVMSLGYGDLSEGAGTVTKKSGDGGIDGVVRLDRLGLDSVYIQAKRWDISKTVGSPDLQGFVGALVGNGATKGVFITTSKFSNEARKYAEESMRSSNIRLVLIDGHALANLMIECSVGVSTKTTYEIKSVDSDFFDAE